MTWLERYRNFIEVAGIGCRYSSPRRGLDAQLGKISLRTEGLEALVDTVVAPASTTDSWTHQVYRWTQRGTQRTQFRGFLDAPAAQPPQGQGAPVRL